MRYVEDSCGNNNICGSYYCYFFPGSICVCFSGVESVDAIYNRFCHCFSADRGNSDSDKIACIFNEI